ncbi:carboxypeptidase-like regulatory domain-containing protein [Flammeovirgaceae bacterium SG7u.111]|nr:carboxypeptidase-like regulatory domain-containing protein [Flammeovirgaceae bacterium SG7u.132]WPO34890.1 carboxypeptidase-like regulatory domain-containing protein [Flammeovirgaceae bacterium SG7u.111]
MYLKFFVYLPITLGLLLFCPYLAASQGLVEIRGKVMDENGNPTPGVTISLEGSTNRNISADMEGRFEFLGVASGAYTISISGIGYQPQRLEFTFLEQSYPEIEVTLKESVTELDMIVVTGETEASLQKRKGFEIASISVSDFQLQSVEPHQLLERVGGVKVRQQGGLGSRSDFFVNGLGGRAIRFFLDGIPMDYFGSSYSINTIPISQIDRMDVYKGVVPVELGNDALGGAINIVTKSQYDNALGFSYSFGSFNTHRASVLGNWRDAKSGFTVKLSGFYNYSDNDYKVWGNDIYVTDLETFEITRDIEVKRFHDAFESGSVKADIGVTGKKWTDQFFVGILLSGMNKEIQHGATMEVPFGEALYNQNVIMPYLTYQKKNVFVPGLDVTLFSSWSKLERNREDSTRNIYNWYGQIEGNRTLGGEQTRTLNSLAEEVFLHRVNLAYQWTDWLSAGFNYLFTDLTRTDDDPLVNILQKTEGYYAPQLYQKHSTGFALQGEWLEQRLNATLFAKSFTYSADIRYSEYEEGEEMFKVAYSGDTNYGYGMAGSYQLVPWLRVNASLESAVRLPEPDELLGDGLLIDNNPELSSELSQNINLGFDLSLFSLSDNTVRLSGNGFYRMVTDLIQQTFSQEFEGQFVYQNIDKVLMRGADFSLQYDHKRWLQFNQTISWLNPVIKSEKDALGNDNVLQNTRLSNLPFFQANSNLRINLTHDRMGNNTNNLFFYWNFNYVGAFYRNSEEIGQFGRDEIPEQFVHGTGVGYTFLSNSLTLSFDVNNLFNRQVFDDFAIQKPGRGAYVKATYQLF